MKKCLFALVVLALLKGATLLAQGPPLVPEPVIEGLGVLPPAQPIAQPIGQPIAQPTAPIQPPVVVIQGAPVLDHGCCAPSRCHCPPHECVPEPYKKVTKKVVFTSGCEPMCLPPCCGGCCLLKCCLHQDDCGGQPKCGHAYNVRYLIKKRIRCEEEATKCVPVPCGQGGCNHGPACATSVLSPSRPLGEPIPSPKVLEPIRK